MFEVKFPTFLEKVKILTNANLKILTNANYNLMLTSDHHMLLSLCLICII